MLRVRRLIVLFAKQYFNLFYLSVDVYGLGIYFYYDRTLEKSIIFFYRICPNVCLLFATLFQVFVICHSCTNVLYIVFGVRVAFGLCEMNVDLENGTNCLSDIQISSRINLAPYLNSLHIRVRWPSMCLVAPINQCHFDVTLWFPFIVHGKCCTAPDTKKCHNHFDFDETPKQKAASGKRQTH